MLSLKNSSNNGRRGIALMITAAMSIVFIPMVGLSVDTAILYVVKTKLSAAVDAAALAGARSLSRGADFSSQQVSAQAAAQNYFNANFPSGVFLGTTASQTTTVTLNGASARVVATTATATVPVYFLRMLPNAPPTVTVNVSATAQRRDSNVVLVLDRSKSLADSGSCGTLKSAAAGFVDKFSEQRDYLSLTTFASSSYYTDYPISNTFKSSSPALTDIINNINCVGGTNSAQGLWNGYTTLANLNQPGALNVIVFFTDGDPTAFPGTFLIKLSSPCTSKANKDAVLTMTSTPGPYGLLNLSNGPVPIANDNATLSSGAGGCAFVGSPSSVATDVQAIPAADYFGDNTNTGYAGSVTLALGGSASTNATSINNASINAADEAAKHIRNGDAITKVMPGAPAAAVGKQIADVVIFSIGLGNSGAPPNADFLKRVANDPASSSHDPTKHDGLYLYAQTAADLNDAFDKVAAEILRLAK